VQTGLSIIYADWYSFLADIADERFRLLWHILPLCLSHLCIVLKRQKLSTQFPLHTTVQCFSKIVLKFGLHRSTLSKFFRKMTHPCWLDVGDIRRQIAAKWLEIAQWSQWRAYMYREPPSLFKMVPLLTSTTSPSPKMGVLMHRSDVALNQIT